MKLSLVLVALAIVAVGMTSATRRAEALEGDVCQMITWDSTGTVLNDGDVVGGDGSIYLVFRIEDDSFGYVNDFLDGPVQDLIQPLYDELADIEQQIIDAGYPPDVSAEEIEQMIFDLGPIDTPEKFEENEELNDVLALVYERDALQEIIDEIEAALEFKDYTLVQIDSKTGSASLTSKLEIAGFEWVKPRVDHVLLTPVLSTYVDHLFPTWFTDPDGHDLDSIRAWLAEVAGVPVPSAVSDAADVCGSSEDDGWSFVDLKCTAAGGFRINVHPHRPLMLSEPELGTRDLICPGAAESASIAASRSTLETQPVGSSTDKSLITVTAYDKSGNNVDGAEVKFITNTCTFTNPNAGVAGDLGISPAALGPVVTVYSDTEKTAGSTDQNFLTNNPSQLYAGTAEVTLDCSKGVAGTVTVTAVVTRNGADITLSTTVDLVGPTASSGLTLTLTPDSLECGEVLLATAKAVDANGKAVSDGTVIHFTTDTSSGIVGGQEGGQGANQTINGETTVTVAVSPDDPGVHTVIAWTVDKNGALLSQVSQLFECTSPVAAVAPTIAAPATGTGTNSITPPNTGDAGLAGATGGHSILLLLVTAAGLGACCVLPVTRLYGRRR